MDKIDSLRELLCLSIDHRLTNFNKLMLSTDID